MVRSGNSENGAARLWDISGIPYHTNTRYLKSLHKKVQ